MAEKLFALICVAEVSADTLSEVISTAYKSETDSGPNILLINDSDFVKGSAPTGPTSPPIPKISNYPFLGKPLKDLESFLDTIPADWSISNYRLLIADEQTTKDKTLLFVELADPRPETVRLNAAHANAIPIAVGVATMDIQSIRSLADDDGVYRGDPAAQPPRQGGPAPRRQLRSGGSS
jgi:hypothetical protein